MNLGFISEKYESGGAGPGTISQISDDPGGKSYGTYQFSKKTLFDYIQQAPFKFNAPLFTADFDLEWLEIADKYLWEFALDQHLFITKKLYLPNIIYARSLGYQTWGKRLQEAIFSISVQHGGAQEIIKTAFVANGEGQIETLYAVRWKYVRKLGLSEKLKESLQTRYKHELQDVMSIEEVSFGYFV